MAAHDLPDLLAAGPLSAAEIGARLGVSQPTVSRLVAAAGEQVVRLGRGRNTRWALARAAFGQGSAIPLYGIDRQGVAERLAILRPLAGGGYLLEGEPLPRWLGGEAGDGRFPGLPYFLDDLRPQGFLGRHAARAHAARSGVPPDPREWSEEVTGGWLATEGWDLPGHLLLGEPALRRFERQEEPIIEDRAEAYPRLAAIALAGELPGSSAGGEQPKFTARVAEVGAVIVKFSPAGSAPEAVRWRDLLVAEHHAQAALAAAGVPAAQSVLHEFGGRLFLESRRFDRVGARGRRPLLSLAAVDAEFAGVGSPWPRAANALARAGLLDAEAVALIVRAHTFGHWIGNSDMHLRNLSLTPAGERFEPLPLYDMLPMQFAPIRGELTRPALRPPVREPSQAAIWHETGAAALGFWHALAASPQLSAEFRAIAADCRREVAAALGGPEPG